MPPELIAGRYRVEREVGRGGMGSVWLCQDERLGRPVAVKQVGGLPGESSMHLARALREARHSAALNHPNVVTIFDALEEGDHVLLVMEYVPGRTLDELVHDDGPLAPPVAAGIVADVADGLAAAHALGTVHRDVKPSNVLVREDDGRALIADFGIARTLGEEQLTRSGLVTGTPTYFAPELARGGEPTPASDVWALGVTLYVALEGVSPYPEQANAIAVLHTIANEPAPVPTRAGPLAPLLRRMLDPDPAGRCSMAEAARELRAVAAGAGTAAPEPEPTPPPPPVAPVERPADTVPTPVAPPPRRRSRAPLVALLAAVALLVVAGGGWWLTRDPGDDGEPDPAADGRSTPTASRSPSQRPTRSEEPSPTASEPAPETGSESDSESASGSPTESAPEEGEVDSPAALVTAYYGALPEDTDAAWSMLTPGLQEEFGRGGFDGFWATVDSVRVEGADEVEDGVVEVRLVYTTDGREEAETRQLAVERSGDGWLISEDRGAV